MHPKLSLLARLLVAALLGATLSLVAFWPRGETLYTGPAAPVQFTERVPDPNYGSDQTGQLLITSVVQGPQVLAASVIDRLGGQVPSDSTPDTSLDFEVANINAWNAATTVLRPQAPTHQTLLITSTTPQASRAGVRGGDRLIADRAAADGTRILSLIGRDGTPREVAVNGTSDAFTTTQVGAAQPPVRVWRGQYSGQSAGLVMAIAYLDAYTEGDLTAGEVIAATGTIDALGTVGPISGVAQKVEGALRQDADLMLVPSLDYPEAVAAAQGRIAIVAVDDLDSALRLLCQRGGQAQGICH